MQEHTPESQLRDWLASYPRRQDVTIRDETTAQRQARIFKGLLYDLQMAIDEFGYEVVYFGVGCEAFPDAVDPWAGNEH